MKVSIVIPVYYNEENLIPLYKDMKKKFMDVIDYEYEIVMVNDGSKDKSYEVMKQLSQEDPNIKIVCQGILDPMQRFSAGWRSVRETVQW